MPIVDIIVSVASVLVAGITIAWMRHLAKHAGRDRPHDPERLHRFIANAPYKPAGSSGMKAGCSRTSSGSGSLYVTMRADRSNRDEP